MDVYGSILSPYVARVILAARHKGIKHKLKMPDGGMKTPAYLAMNPLGKMPVIKDSGMTLYESSVIIDYLDAKYKKKRVIPSAAKDAAKARLIATIFAEYVQAPTMALLRQRDPATRDQKVIEEKIAEANRGLDVIEKLLSGKGWATGTKLTVADLYAVPCWFFVSAFLPQFGVADPTGGRKKLGKYVAKLNKEKLTATVMAEMGEALKNFRPGGR
ncbi:MAG: glutathione S-transferase family protein [Rhodospirillaceae bacterium]|nr:glutathione S-transferase family protein [Rhodospirillaceae bacterium]